MAGYHRSTFYEYFTDIYDLLEQEEAELIELFNQNIVSPIANSEINPFDTAAVVGPVSGVYAVKGERIADLGSAKGDPGFRENVQSFMKQALAGAFHLKELTPEMSYILEFLSAGMISIVNKAYSDKDMSIGEIVSFLHPLLSGAVLGYFTTNNDIG